MSAAAPHIDGKPAGDAPEAPAAPAAPKAGDYVTDDHILSLTDLAAKFTTDVNPDEPKKSRGLTAPEAAARLAKYGPNALTPPPVIPQWLKFLIKLSNPFLVMLNAAGALSVICYGIQPDPSINL